MEMNRHKMREVAMTSLYQHLLLGKDIRECVYENCDSNDIDPFLYTITMDTVRYKDAYIDKISEKLNREWTFDRLGFVEQATLYGHPLQREVAFLTVHSMLHLLGYDHENGGLEAMRMREKEEAVLLQLGLPRTVSYTE